MTPFQQLRLRRRLRQIRNQYSPQPNHAWAYWAVAAYLTAWVTLGIVYGAVHY